jgi:hypothetical protein
MYKLKKRIARGKKKSRKKLKIFKFWCNMMLHWPSPQLKRGKIGREPGKKEDEKRI